MTKGETVLGESAASGVAGACVTDIIGHSFGVVRRIRRSACDAPWTNNIDSPILAERQSKQTLSVFTSLLHFLYRVLAW